MKRIMTLVMLLFCLLTAGQLFAQVDVRIHPHRSQFMVGENVVLHIKITNHTDEILVLDNTPDRPWLHFTVTPGGSSQPMAPKVQPVFDKIVVKPGSAHETTVNLRPYFHFSRVGGFKVVASIRMPDMQSTYSSNRTTFNLVNGGPVKTFAIQHEGKRLMMHVKMMRAGEKDWLFGQVVNADSGVVVGACALGQYLNFMKPRVMMDKRQNLHVLCQSTPQYFTYSVMGPDGTRLSYQVLQRTGGPVNLVSGGKGIQAIGLTPARNTAGKDPYPSIRKTSDR